MVSNLFAEQSKKKPNNLSSLYWYPLTESTVKSIKGIESVWSVGVGFVCTSGLPDRKADEEMEKIKGDSGVFADRRRLLWPLWALFWIPNYFGKLEFCPHFPSLSTNQDFDLVES